MKKFKVHIRGIAPLLQARHPSPEENQKILERKSGKKAKVKDLTDKEQFAIHAYKVNGKFYQPSDMIEAAMTCAAVNFKMEGKKTYKDVMKGGIIVDPIKIIHKKQNFVMDAQWGKNPTTRGAVWVVRPRIDDWELEFTIDLLQDERIGEETLKDILVYAGLYVGIGAYRPKHGRFSVVSFKEVKSKK